VVIWNTGNPKVKGSIWSTKYGGHNIEVQLLKVFDDMGNRRERYRLYIDDKCLSKDITSFGDEPEAIFDRCSGKILSAPILDENGELHKVECVLYFPEWKKRPTKSMIIKLFCTLHVQVVIFVDDEIIYDSFYESDEEKECEKSEMESIELQKDEKARSAGKEPVYTRRGKKYVRTDKLEARRRKWEQSAKDSDHH